MKLPNISLVAFCFLTSLVIAHASPEPAPEGFTSLFNGKDLTGWKVPEGDNGHWKVLDGVIDYDAQSEAKGEKHLWSGEEYGDFELIIEWRIKETTGFYNVPYVLPDGTTVKGEDGKNLTHPIKNADSGIYLRGTSKAQLNIWCWPIGSGEVYGYRNDAKQPAEVRAGVTPKLNPDNPVGSWNKFHITMKGDRLTVVSNGHTIIENAQLPEIPEKGGIALQHHGGKKADGEFFPRLQPGAVSEYFREEPGLIERVTLFVTWASKPVPVLVGFQARESLNINARPVADSFHLDPPPGFLGFREREPTTHYQRHLPHWRQAGATYFTTFRLGDSLPAAALREFQQIRREWEKKKNSSDPNEPESQGDLAIHLSKRAEHWLDQGHGSCVFRTPKWRDLLAGALKFFDLHFGNDKQQSRYELGAYVIMPNHVHCLVRPLLPDDFSLEDIEKSWKQFVSRRINGDQGTTGSIWFQESYDRIARDAEHLYRCLQYIGRNPDKASLREGEYSRWVSPKWLECGWGFRAK